MALTMEDLLKAMVERRASDLHIIAGLPPFLRVDQKLVPLVDRPLAPSETRSLIYSVLTDNQKKRLETELELDFAISIEGVSRFRANAYWQKGTLAAAIRRIPIRIPTPEKLGLPPVVSGLAQKSQGLVLVTGPTGSGKTTTLASLINKINNERSVHIITIEDPIEYVFVPKLAIISQREVEQDTQSFARALKFALRQDPDVIMVGEMRDVETIAAALTAAETGHLVLATLHTYSAIESINRIIDVFPAHQQAQIRTQLAQVVEAVIAQRLLPRASGKGLALAVEVMIATPAIRTLIRESRIHEIYGVIQTSQRYGMRTMNMSLIELYRKGEISWQTALLASPNPEELKRMGREAGVVVA
ncbi:MAG: type IV pili twitching motility protein PilT [Candidatus Hydrothermota bacterium]|nr:MAG: type IV pili twitching motility protein PilT [Candidatus Hydrothermae bacterium]